MIRNKRTIWCTCLCILLVFIGIFSYQSKYLNHYWIQRMPEYKENILWKDVKVRELSQEQIQETHDKWIVITTINPPTEDVKKLAKIPGWKVVVVGDTKSPPDWNYNNCIFLDIKKQEALGYRITKLLKYRAYTRKNIGYLYAIEHGAKIIYETDDDNSPTTGKIEFDENLSKEYLVYQKNADRVVVNPNAHFGQSSIWPRGYPLDMISKSPVRLFQRCQNRKALIQQGVVNGDPDVDAIFRLTRKDEGVKLNVEFDDSAQPVVLPRGLLAPYNTQNTLHLYNAFWGLLLPQTVAFRVCDIWRGYWAQRLLWDVDGYLSFFGPNARQFRNAHRYLDDFIDEKELYHESSDFVKFLVQWTSSEHLFFDRVLELSQKMAENNFWKKDDVSLVQYWLQDLISVGYKPPELKTGTAYCDTKLEEILPVEQASSYLRLNYTLKKIF